MSRKLLELALLYLAPFALYGLALLLRRAYVLSLDRWTRAVLTRLSLAGLALVLCSLLYTAVVAPRHEGAYAPAHIENGHLVSGTIK